MSVFVILTFHVLLKLSVYETIECSVQNVYAFYEN